MGFYLSTQFGHPFGDGRWCCVAALSPTGATNSSENGTKI